VRERDGDAASATAATAWSATITAIALMTADKLILGAIDGLVANLQDATGDSTFVQVALPLSAREPCDLPRAEQPGI
jgi:hypothetical protein